MSITKPVLLVALTALAAAAPAAAGRTATITISHQMRGCHMWQLGNAAPKPTLSITLRAGTVLRFVDNDVMPHWLVQQSGPKVTLIRPGMTKMGASASAKLVRRGVYRFTTKAGGDYAWVNAMERMGKDYVLHLTVHVK